TVAALSWGAAFRRGLVWNFLAGLFLVFLAVVLAAMRLRGGWKAVMERMSEATVWAAVVTPVLAGVVHRSWRVGVVTFAITVVLLISLVLLIVLPDVFDRMLR